MSAETTIKFGGDEAFLNALTNPQPLARPAAIGEVGMAGSAGYGATLHANAFGGPVAGVVNPNASTHGQPHPLSPAFYAAEGFSLAVAPDRQPMAKGTAAGAKEGLVAAGTPAKAAATGHDALAFSGALFRPDAPAAATAASVSALAASAKKRGDSSNGNVDESSLQAAMSDDFVDIYRGIRRTPRPDGFRLLPDKGDSRDDPFGTTASDIGLKVLALLSSAWETSRPLLETMHDNLVEMSARLSELGPVVVDLRDATKAASVEARAKPEKDDVEATTLTREQSREAWKQSPLDNGMTIEQNAQSMADRLIQSLGPGTHGPRISPSRR